MRVQRDLEGNENSQTNEEKEQELLKIAEAFFI